MNNRNFQLQGSYTRYYDGHHSGYDGKFGPCKQRNYTTLESAIKAAKKELKENELPKVVKVEIERDSRGLITEFTKYAEDGHIFEYGEKCAFWHVDGMRIVDRITQKIIWES